MHFASAISRAADAVAAVDEVEHALRAELPQEPNLLLAFASPHHTRSYARLPALLTARFPGATVTGCSGAGVVGGRLEVQSGPALSVVAAELPGVTVAPFHLRTWDMPLAGDGHAWQRRLGLRDPRTHVLLFADPFSCDVEPLVAGLDAAFPDGRKLGGVASGGRLPQTNALFVGSSFQHSGVTGVTLTGDIAIETIIGQGCRPIGEPRLVSECEDNVILALDGQPPLEVLRELYLAAGDRERELFQRALFVGVEMRDQREYKPGDFLVRDILAVDRERGSIAVAAQIARWQAVQFHVREPRAATLDLALRLEGYRRAHGKRPSGGIMLSCVARGEELFGRPNHDSDLVRDQLGAIPLGGFFGHGEIGSVGDRTFLHGHTSVFGLFRPLMH